MNLPSCIAIFYIIRQKCTITRLLLLCIFAVAPHAGAGIEIVSTYKSSRGACVAPHAGAGIAVFLFRDDVALIIQRGDCSGVVYGDCVEVLNGLPVGKCGFIPAHLDPEGMNQLFRFLCFSFSHDHIPPHPETSIQGLSVPDVPEKPSGNRCSHVKSYFCLSWT